MSIEAAVLCGALGGLAAEFWSINIHRGKRLREFPDEMKTFSYWAFGLVWVAIGAALAGGYEYLEGVSLTWYVAINIGASAPLVIEGLIRSPPETPPGKGG